MSVLRFLSGKMILYRVARSIRKSPYFMPPMAVLEPKTISMWKISPNLSGRDRELWFLFGVGIAATSPRDVIGSGSGELIWKLRSETCLISLMI